MFDFFGSGRIRELQQKLEYFKHLDTKSRKIVYDEGFLKGSEGITELEVYNKKLINSAKVIFTAMRNDAEHGNLTAAKVRAYRKKFFECEKDEQS